MAEDESSEWANLTLGDREEGLLTLMSWLKPVEAEKVRRAVLHSATPWTYDDLPDWLIGWLTRPDTIPKDLLFDPEVTAQS